MMRRHKFPGLALLLILICSGSSLADQEDDENALNCIHVSRIKSTKIVDDLHILFYMYGKTDYYNILPRQCRGLSREGRFSYRVSANTLCQLDSIRLLYDSASGLEEGISCRLGFFHPVTKEDIEAILDPEPRRPPPEPLPSAEPEEIIKETDESG